jgi:hypothetical protein
MDERERAGERKRKNGREKYRNTLTLAVDSQILTFMEPEDPSPCSLNPAARLCP